MALHNICHCNLHKNVCQHQMVPKASLSLAHFTFHIRWMSKLEHRTKLYKHSLTTSGTTTTIWTNENKMKIKKKNHQAKYENGNLVKIFKFFLLLWDRNCAERKIWIFYFSIHIAHTLCNIPFEMIYLK